jgi:hypothetical protein
MSKRPKTTGEHIVALYGHITGLKKSISTIQNNHLKHLHQDVEKINDKFDKLIFWIVGGIGAIALIFLAQVLYFLSK